MNAIELIQMRNRMRAVSIASALVVGATCKYNFECTEMRSHLHAVSTAGILFRVTTYLNTLEFMQMRIHEHAVSALVHQVFSQCRYS